MISPALPRLTQGVLAALAARFGFLFLAIGVPGLFVTIVKRLIGRARPISAGSHDDPFVYRPFIWRPEYASMPSGHATTAVGGGDRDRRDVAAHRVGSCGSTRSSSCSAASSCWRIIRAT